MSLSHGPSALAVGTVHTPGEVGQWLVLGCRILSSGGALSSPTGCGGVMVALGHRNLGSGGGSHALPGRRGQQLAPGCGTLGVVGPQMLAGRWEQ